MFESAELGHKVDKERYEAEEPKLRNALLDAQYELVDKKQCSVVILIAGVDGAGKGERVGETDWKHLEMYKRFQSTAQHLLRGTSTADAPWLIVEGGDERYRNLTIGTSILNALRVRLDAVAAKNTEVTPMRFESIDGVTVIDRMKLDQKVGKDDYHEQNREKWDDYNLAVCEMVDRTSTEHAPWTLVEANNKHFARLKILRTMVEAIENAL